MLSWLKSWFSHREKALSLYRSGMAKAKKDNFAGAIADYNAAIQGQKIPADVRAMVLYNRALAYSAMDEDTKAAADLSAVLEMPAAPEKIKTAASHRRERMRRREKEPDTS